jgi:hypothetical protein
VVLAIGLPSCTIVSLSVSYLWLSIILPLYALHRTFLREDGEHAASLVDALREILLQEKDSHADIDHVIAELVQCTCNEMGFGSLSSSRRVAFDFLLVLYRLPEGKNEVTRLGGGILRDVAEKMHRG